MEFPPLLILVVGIVIVIGMIVWLKANAFIALITAAIVVSLMAPGSLATKIDRVAGAFGSTAGSIGIVIALAAVIGKCMMDSGAADRIVRAFLTLFGEKRSSAALMGSGFTLSVPVFFDTAFYLLVPLARSLYRSTNKNYLKYVMAITSGAAITHTLVPPTPGPLFMANKLGVDLGVMIGMGIVIALPSSIVGLIYSAWLDRRMPIEMRSYTDGQTEPEPLADDELPGLLLSALPIVLPIILITLNSIVKTTAQQELIAQYSQQSSAESSDTTDPTAGGQPQEEDGDGDEGENEQIPLRGEALTAALVDAAAEGSTSAKLFTVTNIIGNPSLALLVSAGIALWTLFIQRKPTLIQMGQAVETALMSGGVIILITAAGGAFGGMLKEAQIGPAIEELFGGTATSGIPLLFFAFFIATLIKFAQGSSTSAMIVTSGMIGAMITPDSLSYNMVYLATAIGSGSLIGSWMNDSGFWIFAKMSGLTEIESLKSWTPLLIVLGVVGMISTVTLAILLPLS